MAYAIVILLAGIAAAISCCHMHELAIRHSETGWRAHVPICLDQTRWLPMNASDRSVLFCHSSAGAKG